MLDSASSGTDADETSMIRSVKDGDNESFRPLVERYQAGVIRYVFYLVRDEATAEDIAQDAFLTAYRKIGQYNDRYAFSTWLYRIARNLAYRQVRTNKSLPLEMTNEPASDRPDLSESLDKDIEAARVRNAIAKLKPDQRTVIYLYYWEDKSYEEIADIMNRPINTVRTWLRRAKQELRSKL